MDQRHPLVDSSLAELREIVVASRDMPAGSVVRVRTRFSGNADGSLLKRALIIAPEPSPWTDEPDGPQPGSLFAPQGTRPAGVDDER